MDPARTMDFATAARTLHHEARRRGIVAPGFRSPPRLVGVDRTLRRRGDHGVVIAVRVRGRPLAAVVADMIEGVVVANRLRPPDADRLRTELWVALGAVLPLGATTSPGRTVVGTTAGSSPDAPTAHAPVRRVA